MVGSEDVSYAWLGNTLTATIDGGDRDGTKLFTVEMTDAANGDYKVTLLTNVLHTGGDDAENNDESTALTYTVTRDTGGAESQSFGGNVLTNDAPGADGVTVTHINLGDEWVDLSTQTAEGGVYTRSNSDGTYTIKADGTWTFDPDDSLASASYDAGFSYRITDADGDTSEAAQPITVDTSDNTTTGTLTVNFDDDVPEGKTVTSATVLDDDAQTLFAGNAGGSGDVTNATVVTGAAGSLFRMGADRLPLLEFTNPTGQQAIYKGANGLGAKETLNYATMTSAGHTIFTATGATSGNTVFTLDVAADGSYTFTVSKPLVHSTNSTTEWLRARMVWQGLPLPLPRR